MRSRVRQVLRASVALFTAEAFLLLSVSSPVEAFQISSATGYARYVPQAAQAAYVATNRAQIIAAAAPAISASTAGSIAVRAVTGPLGWAALAVQAGLLITGIYYSQQQVKDIQAAAGSPGSSQIPGYAMPTGGKVTRCVTVSALCPFANDDAYLLIPSRAGVVGCDPTGLGNPPAGWSGWYSYQNNCHAFHPAGQPHPMVQEPPTATPTQVADYMRGLPASDPLAPEQNAQPGGTTNPAPTSDTTVDVPVSPNQMPSVVGPANNVPDGSSVVNSNAPAPQQQQQTAQQTSKETTTTNLDGSQTQDSTATVACNAGAHDQRSFGQVLADHQRVWQSSGLMGTLNFIKNITWPTTFPTYTLTSTMFGTMTFDFNAWSGMINALRALVVAGAGFAAYRIIFVGGSGGGN